MLTTRQSAETVTTFLQLGVVTKPRVSFHPAPAPAPVLAPGSFHNFTCRAGPAYPRPELSWSLDGVAAPWPGFSPSPAVVVPGPGPGYSAVAGLVVGPVTPSLAGVRVSCQARQSHPDTGRPLSTASAATTLQDSYCQANGSFWNQISMYF